MIKFITKNQPSDRRAVPLDPATVLTIDVKPGQILKQGALPNRYAVKADGAAVVAAPLFAFTATSRKDVQAAASITVVDGPFVAELDTDAYVGSPVLDSALKLGTGGSVGKLVVATMPADWAAMLVIAMVSRVADADGFIEVKVQR